VTDDLFETVAPIASPCVNICRIERGNRHCTGCGRTSAEIARWSYTDDADRAGVMAELPRRMRGM